MDAGFIQKRMNEMQQSEEFAATMGKILSGRPGYKPVVEKKYVPLKCKKCGAILDDSEKFCHECGTRVEK
jgi:hypothetical protein